MRLPSTLLAAAPLAASLGGALAEPVAGQTVEAALGEVAVTFEAPIGAETSMSGDGALLLRTRPGTRTDPLIVLRLDPEPGPRAEARVFEHGATLRFDRSIGPGGSGGETLLLDGTLGLDGLDLGVVCIGQREGARLDDALWCLDVLGSIRLAAPPLPSPE